MRDLGVTRAPGRPARAAPAGPRPTGSGVFALQQAAGGALPPGLRDYLAASRGTGRGLEPAVRRPLERSFGRDLGQVRVHAGPGAAWAARSVRARAFALGKDIWFGAGEYRPDDPAGRRLLAHEIAHTVEQRAPATLDQVRVGAASDPAEERADRAADAVVRAAPAPASATSESVIRRYSISRVDRRMENGEPVVRVDLDNGIRYHVRRPCRLIQEPTTERRFRPPSVRGAIDRENVYVEITWCQGTRGRVTAGVDIPEQLQEAARRVIEGALAGRRPDQVLSETTLTPFVDFAVAQSGGVAVEGRVEVTVGLQGVQAAEGSLSVRSGPLDVSAGVRGEVGGDVVPQLTLRFTPGRTSERFDCPTTSRRRERLTYRCDFECTHAPINPPPAPPRPEPTREPRTATLYFTYSESTFNGRLYAPQAEELRRRLREGFRVQAIRGYASPEGPLERRTAGFQGNRSLSAERAQAALAEVRRLCTEAGVEGSCLVAPDAPVTGCGERLGGAPECPSPQEGEVRGERQGRAVAHEAVREFMADPTEMARLTAEDATALASARTDEQKAQIIYPYLRRASLDLVRIVQPPRPRIDVRSLLPDPDYFLCPDDVIEAARPHLEGQARPGPRR